MAVGTIGHINIKDKEYLTPGHRSDHERKKSEGYHYRNIAVAEEGGIFDLACKICPKPSSLLISKA